MAKITLEESDIISIVQLASRSEVPLSEEQIKALMDGDKVYVCHPFAVILKIVDSMTRLFLKTIDYILYFFNYSILVIKTVQFKNGVVHNNP